MKQFVSLSILFILTIVSHTSHAQANFGNWSVGRLDADEGFYAATINDMTNYEAVLSI